MSPVNTVSKYLSLVKFSHTVFAMPFAFIGYFLAIKQYNYPFDWKLLILIVLCMIFARNAAMSFNRYIDRKYDKLNPRTAGREIPGGEIKTSSALIFIVANSVFFIITTYFINYLVFFLSPVALLVILGYSFTKRFTFLCHIILGIGISLAPVGAFISVTGEFALLPVLFSFIVLFWVGGFDIIYSLQDDEFDTENNLYSIPAAIGRKNAIIVSIFMHLISALLVITAGIFWNFGILYWLGTLTFVALLVFQHTLVKPNDISKINLAFFTTNGFAGLIFAIFVIADQYMASIL